MAYKYAYDDEVKEVKIPPLQTNRSMWKLMILTYFTFGLYSIFFFIPFSFDIDKIAPQSDRSKTPNYIIAFIVALFTFSIVIDVWHYQIAARIQYALSERNIDYEFSTSDFWGWFIFGSLILIGPFVYFHKLCKAMNLLCEDYNKKSATKQEKKQTNERQ